MSRRIVLGTAGHIDHGKTTLVKALTGIDTDRLKEEKKRGITIELGFAHLTLDDGQRVGIVDVPGHERFVRHMVAGASGVDLVALVIAADEGVMPQTREHVDICQLLGVKAGVVVLTKIDLVDQDWLDLVSEDVKDYLAQTFLRDAPLVPVSAFTGQGLDELRRILTELSAEVVEREQSGPFRLPVDRVFTMKGFGTVITGTSLSGRVAVGQTVTVFPRGLQAKVRGLQVHGQEVESASSGLRTALNLQGLERQEIKRGDVIASPGALAPSRRLDASLKLLSSAPRELKNRAQVHFHVGASEMMARVIPLDVETIKPGQEGLVQIITEEEASCLPGDHYVIRTGTLTLGGGRVLAVAPPRRRRLDPASLEALSLLRDGQTGERLAWLVRESRLLGLGREELKARLGLNDKELDALIQDLLSKRLLVRFDREAQRFVHLESLEQVSAAILDLLAEFHRAKPLKEGLPREELKTRLRLHADPKLVTFAAGRLVEEGRLRAEADLIALAGHRVALAEDQSLLKDKILEAHRRAGLAPPRLNELDVGLSNGQLKDVLALLIKEGKLVKVKEDLYFDSQALDRLREKMVEFLESHGQMTTQDFKDLAGVSRKFLIPLAEHFDKQGVTIRVGEVRRLRARLA